MASEVMTVVELAEYLKLNRQTVYRKFQRGELPGVRIGKAIRFSREVVDGWLRASSFRWDAEQRQALRRWAERFAKQRSIAEKDVLRAVGARRRARR